MAGSGKRFAKALLRPAVRPLLARIRHLNARIDLLASEGQERAATFEARLAEHEKHVASAEQTFTKVLDAVAGQNALARESRRESWKVHADFAESIARIERRVEFVRKEVMLEVRYGSRAPGDVASVEPEVVNPEKLAVRPLRLNLGCGHIPMEGYVNVDARPLPDVDVVAEVGDLPFERGAVDEIRSAHLLEHFPRARLEGLLSYWFDLLKPGGSFVAVVPDAESMIRSYVAGDIPWQELAEVTFGGQEYSGDFHFTMFSQEDINEMLTGAGFSDVKVVDSARRNGECLEMEVVAYKTTGD